MECPTLINKTNPFRILGLLASMFQFHLGGSAHAPVNGGPVFPGTILGYFGLIKHFLAEFLLFSIILYITLAL